MQCFVRKSQIWISRPDCNHTVDIAIRELPIEVFVVEDCIYIDGNSENLVFVNNKPAESKFTVKEGDYVAIGQIQIQFFREYIKIDGDTSVIESTLVPMRDEKAIFEGFPYYRRSPRVIYRIQNKKIVVQNPPAKKEITKGGLVQMIIPPLCMLAFTILMGVLLKRGAFIFMTAGMTIITTILSISKFLSEVKNMKKENIERIKVYEKYLLKTRKEINAAREEERITLNYIAPSIDKIETMIQKYSSRIYEKGILDDDFLSVNLGYYTGPSYVRVSDQTKELEVKKDELDEKARELSNDYEYIHNIPIEVDLKRAHLGIVGTKANVHEQIKYLMAQITFFHSYRELQVVFIHSNKYDNEFEYMRWYPHLRLSAINVISEISSEQARDLILGSVQQILKERKNKLEEEKKDSKFLPHLLFIIDEPKLIVNHSIMEYLQSEGSELGFSIIYTTDQIGNLPENVKTVCELRDSSVGVLRLEEGERKNREFDVQHVQEVNLEKMARNLCALIHEQGIAAKIPESITFFELFNIHHPHELNSEIRWVKNESHKTLAVPLGVRAKDDIVELNLHEKAHGPHGLVAGTTGSGKSEIIQSYILALAANFHPSEVGFLLIDYKGGGMANLFAKLPHLLGTITNLDKAESMRAMASIKSELARRQRIFSDNNVNHINGYNKLFKLGRVEEPIPHLMIISDEFAELKKEQPEFMAELVSAARIGRSLGIHLILATQKPSGVVDDQIWTNSKFKLCLKVQNAGDSKEMLHTPDAANITQPGRSYLQVGNNEIYELFQSAWSGAVYSEESNTGEEDNRVYLLNAIGQGIPINKDLSGAESSTQIKATQLDVVVEYLAQIYEQQNCKKVMKPWLPSLSHQIITPYLSDIKDSRQFSVLDLKVPLGLIDIPEEQMQEEFVHHFIQAGHLLYMASGGYGKSLFLTNLVVTMAAKNAVRNLNFYIIDFGNSALVPLKMLPHVADYLSLDDNEKISKLQKIILDEIQIRKQKLARTMSQNFNVYNESQSDKLKAIVIVLDNYDVVREIGDEFDAFYQKVSRDGAGLGIFLVATLNRESAMRTATKSNFKEKIAGFTFDPIEVSSLIGRTTISLPDSIKGRALIKRTNINLMQLYTPVAFENELDYIDKLKQVMNRIRQSSSEERARGIPILPEQLFVSEISQYSGEPDNEVCVPIGIETGDLRVQYLNLLEGPKLVIGSSGTGKTNTIQNVIEYCCKKAYQMYLFDARSRGLCQYEGNALIRYAVDKDQIMNHLKEIRERIESRQQEYDQLRETNKTMSPQDYQKKVDPVVVLIDTVQDLAEILTDANQLESLDVLGSMVSLGIYVVVSSDIKLRGGRSKFLTLLAESKTGLILGNAKDQFIFDTIALREKNNQVDFGYVVAKGQLTKTKLICHQE